MPTALERGEKLFAEGKLTEAAACFEEVIKENPEDKQAHNNLAVIACQTDKAHEAVVHFTRALDCDPLYAKAIDNVLELFASLPPGQAAASPEIAGLYLHALLALGKYEAIKSPILECALLINDEQRLRQLLMLAVSHAAPDVPPVVIRLIQAMNRLDDDLVGQIQIWQNASNLTTELRGEIDALIFSKTNEDDTLPQAELQKLTATGPKPKISILVPTYNRADLLEKTLDNLTAQEYSDYEIIVVDDCSTDDTPKVIDKFKARFPDHIYHRNEHNLGAGPNYNLAASLASGEYLLIFSDDDYLTAGALHQFVAPLAEDNYDMVYPDYRIIDDQDRPTDTWAYRSYPDNWELVRHLFRAGGNVIPECLLLRRELYDEFYGDNYDRRLIPPFYLAALDQLKIAHVNRPLYQYRIHSEGMFGSISGLIDRNKGAVNYLNAILYKYDPITVFQTGQCPTPAQAVGEALLRAVQCFIMHGKRFFAGTFYTGQEYTEDDRLYAGFYEGAYYWLRLARKYLSYDERLDQLEESITDQLTEAYDPVAVNELADIYHRLPWYCFRPPGNFTRFVPLDMITLGKAALFEDDSISVYREGKIDIGLDNVVARTVDEVERALSRRIVRVINVCNPDLLDPLVKLLEEKHLYFITVVNFTDKANPAGTLIKQMIHSDGISSIDDYLKILWEAAGSQRWPTGSR